jgi:L-lactate dehydrogenase complex protein LldE
LKLLLMITCLGDCVRPEAGKAVVKVLRRLGHEIGFPENQTCCGQPMFNSGYAELAREQAKHTIRVFDGDEPVVVPSGSCAAMVKAEYPHLLSHDKESSMLAPNIMAKWHFILPATCEC